MNRIHRQGGPTVPLGRRELFAFAERYSSQRLKDYSSLADGVVLCALFNAVFPRRRVRALLPHSHGVAERSKNNWAALAGGFRAVKMPMTLLDRRLIAANSAEKGFSALVLFYFLYNLTRHADFSAEFALDVSPELTAFLQSVDSIASLLLGEAIPWAVVPPVVQAKLCERPEFGCDGVKLALVRDRSASRSRSIALRRPSGPHAREVERQPTAHHSLRAAWEGDVLCTDSDDTVEPTTQLSTSGSDGLLTSSVAAPGTRDGSASGLDRWSPTREFRPEGVTNEAVEPDSTVQLPSRCTAARSPDRTGGRTVLPESGHLHDAEGGLPVRERQTTPPQREALEDGVSARERHLERLLARKTEECHQLQTRGVALLAEVATLRVRLMATPRNGVGDVPTGSHRSLPSTSASQRAESSCCSGAPSRHDHEIPPEQTGGYGAEQAVGDDMQEEHTLIDSINTTVIDSTTHTIVDVHSIADRMSKLIIQSVSSSAHQGELQQQLWTFLSAYHVMESRVQAVCGVARKFSSRYHELRHQLSQRSAGVAGMSGGLTTWAEPRTTVARRATDTVPRSSPAGDAEGGVGPTPPTAAGALHHAVKALEHDFLSECGGSQSGYRLPTPAPQALSASSTACHTGTLGGHIPDHEVEEVVSSLERDIGVLHRRHDESLQTLHANEESLRAAVEQWSSHALQLRDAVQHREGAWRELCAALHRAERISFNIAGSDNTDEVEVLLEHRERCFADVKRHTVALAAIPLPEMQQPLPREDAVAASNARNAICVAMETMVSDLIKQRDAAVATAGALRHQLTRRGQAVNQKVRSPRSTAPQGGSPPSLPPPPPPQSTATPPPPPAPSEVIVEVRRSIDEQRQYEYDAVWSVRGDTLAVVHSPEQPSLRTPTQPSSITAAPALATLHVPGIPRTQHKRVHLREAVETQESRRLFKDGDGYDSHAAASPPPADCGGAFSSTSHAVPQGGSGAELSRGLSPLLAYPRSLETLLAAGFASPTSGSTCRAP